MHADSFRFLPKALQFAFQDYKSIWSAKADSGLLARGLSNVEKWPQDLGKSAIENYGSISLGHLNQSLLHPKYLDIFIFFFLSACLLWGFSGIQQWVRQPALSFDDMTWATNDPGKCLCSLYMYRHSVLSCDILSSVSSWFQPVFITSRDSEKGYGKLSLRH